MSFRVQAEDLRRHADSLETQARVWRETVSRKLDAGGTDLTPDALTASGTELGAAYHEVRHEYATGVDAVARGLLGAADLLRRAAETYGDADSAIADTF